MKYFVIALIGVLVSLLIGKAFGVLAFLFAGLLTCTTIAYVAMEGEDEND